MEDIVIIGAGVIGLSIARELSKYELSVSLLEKDSDVSTSVSGANSGIIHGGFDDKYGSVKSKYCPKGSNLFEILDKELNFGYKKIGSLVLSYSNESDKTIKHLYENGLKNGVEVEILLKEQIKEIEPNLTQNYSVALHSPQSGIVSPYEYAIALAENSVENGLNLYLNQEVKSINKTDYGYEIITQDKVYKSKIVINCAGLYSDEISKMLSVSDYQIKPRKGEYVIFDRGTGGLVNKVIFQCPTKMGKGVLISPTYHDNLIIGPDAHDIENKSDTSTDIKSIEEIIAMTKEILPCLPTNKAIKTFAGLRPISTFGSDFVLREKLNGFIETIGIASPGLTSSPAIALDIVENYISKHFKMTKKSNFKKDRKPLIKSNSEKEFIDMKEVVNLAKLPLDDPNCMVCRCEQVSRKTIDDAISRGIDIKTVDAVKKRVRAGMGICGGQFCSPRVKQILAKHLNTDTQNIKQRSNDLSPNRVSREDILKIISNFNSER